MPGIPRETDECHARSSVMHKPSPSKRMNKGRLPAQIEGSASGCPKSDKIQVADRGRWTLMHSHGTHSGDIEWPSSSTYPSFMPKTFIQSSEILDANSSLSGSPNRGYKHWLVVVRTEDRERSGPLRVPHLDQTRRPSLSTTQRRSMQHLFWIK